MRMDRNTNALEIGADEEEGFDVVRLEKETKGETLLLIAAMFVDGKE